MTKGLTMPRWFYWGLALTGAYIIYRSSEVLLPFILSFVLAYILDPFVDYYERKGLKRGLAIGLVFVIVFVGLSIFIALVIPSVIKQVRQVESGVSKYIREVHREGIKEYDKQLREGTGLPKKGSDTMENDKLPVASPTQYPPVVMGTPTTTITPVSIISISPSVSVTPIPSSSLSPLSSMVKTSGSPKGEAKRNFVDDIAIYWLGLIKKYPVLKEHIGDEEQIKKVLIEREKEIADYSMKILSGISTWAISSLPNLIFIILVPILTFYFLCVIDPLKDRILFMITDQEKKREVITISNEINVMLGKYLKGQLIVSFMVGVAVTMAAYILSCFFHTKYSLLLGFFTGITYIIPYFGAILSAIAAILIGLFTSPVNPWLAAIVFPVTLQIINQVFDSFISPRIVGEQVGLHPLWTIFALLAGSKLFGVIGMIIAVPIAATIKICLIRIFPRLIEPIPVEERINMIVKKEKEKSPASGNDERETPLLQVEPVMEKRNTKELGKDDTPPSTGDRRVVDAAKGEKGASREE